MKFLILSLLLTLEAVQCSVYTGDDYVLTKAQINYLFNGSLKTNPIKLWPNGRLYYKFASNISASQRQFFRNAIALISKSSCVRFTEASSSAWAYLYITNEDDGCFTYVGFQNNIQQLNLNANYGCWTNRFIVHEVLHALGMLHQHQNYNRDKYLKLTRSNIKNGMAFAFNKYINTKATDYGVQYDYLSIMHLTRYAFSKNGSPTIQRLGNINGQLGSATMSKLDVLRLNNMYC